MKKIFAAFVATAIFCVSLFGCTDNVKEDTESKYTVMTQSVRYTDAEEYQVYRYEYTYADDGRLLLEKMPTGERKYEYNEDGILELSRFTSTTGVITETVYSYDADGRLVNETTGDVNVKAYTYNNKGYCIREEIYTKGSNTVTSVVEYKYDASGRVASVTTTSYGDVDRVVYQYDKDGRVTCEERTFVSVYGGTTLAKSTYSYDDKGNLVKIHYVTESSEGAGALLSFERITEYSEFKEFSKK